MNIGRALVWSIIGCLLIFAGCHTSSSLAGRWKAVVSPDVAALMKKMGVKESVNSYIDIKADGAWEGHGVLGANELGTVTGTWKQNGNQVTFTPPENAPASRSGRPARAETGTLSQDGKTIELPGVKFEKQ